MVGPENRCGYVSYPLNIACHQLGAMSITPSLTFGNAGADPAHKDVYMNYSRNGKHLVGAHAHYNRLAREIVYHNHNFAQHAGLQGIPDPADALQAITYVDDNGCTVHCDPIPFHAVHDANLLAHWRGRYKWHYLNCHEYRINIAKHMYKANQLKLKSALPTSTLAASNLTRHSGIPRWSPKSTSSGQAGPMVLSYSESDIFGHPDSPLSVLDDSGSDRGEHLTPMGNSDLEGASQLLNASLVTPLISSPLPANNLKSIANLQVCWMHLSYIMVTNYTVYYCLYS